MAPQNKNQKNKSPYSNSFDTSNFISELHNNIQTELITITKDKLENILLKYLNLLSLKTMWVTPLSLFITILVALLTSDFKDFLGVKKELWTAIFIIGCIFTGFLTVLFVIRAIKKRTDTSIEALMNKISDSNNG